MLLAALSSMGCTKETVGEWDNRSIDMAIQNWTQRGEDLEVNITMRNNNFTVLPIRSTYFNVYDEDHDMAGCTWTNYSIYDPTIEIKFNETFYILLRFDQFYMGNAERKPAIVEYDLPNNRDRTHFKLEEPPGLLEGNFLYILGASLVGIVLLIAIIIRRRKRSFLE